MKILYLTAQLPFGSAEAFIIPEIEELQNQGHQVVIVPVRPGAEVRHGDAEPLRQNTIRAPVIDCRVLVGALRTTVRQPARVAAVAIMVVSTGHLHARLKNLSVLPKALWLADLIRRLRPDHIHAHWAGTTSTVALIAARLTGVPWSFTAHQWDIGEDNILGLKMIEASFCRTIYDEGAQRVRELVGGCPITVHMGIRIPSDAVRSSARPMHRFVTIASLDDGYKGLRYLVAAARLLHGRGVRFELDMVGSGPLSSELLSLVADARLAAEVRLLGQLPHEEVLMGLESGRWDTAVQPSVVIKGRSTEGTRQGESEGIPVSLIEAMGAGVPAIGTRVGGIPELLGDGAGLLVEPRIPSPLRMPCKRWPPTRTSEFACLWPDGRASSATMTCVRSFGHWSS